jgi:hypothetical protein
VTPGGKVYAETRPGNHLLVLFPTCYGRGSDLQGYLYSNVPLTTRDYYTVNWGAGGIARHLKVGPIDLLTVNPVEAPWYEVTRLVD